MKEKKQSDPITRAIGILSFIPKDKFITNEIANKDSTMCCGIGWLAKKICGNAKEGCNCPTVRDIDDKVYEFTGQTARIAYINDGTIRCPSKYRSINNPKDRVLAALRDVKKAQKAKQSN